jgi:hypothetical protein
MGLHDAMAKDRLPRGPRSWRAVGERVGGARLNVDAVREIRATFDSGAATIAELARRYGVTDMTMGCVVRRKTWRHVG